jgi:NAD(P)H-quinone oxidoreductase subunit 5
LQDYRNLENAIGDRLPTPPGPVAIAPARFRTRLYRFALERGYLDALLDDYIVRPFGALFLWFGKIEGRWTAFLNGTRDPVPAAPQVEVSSHTQEVAEHGS